MTHPSQPELFDRGPAAPVDVAPDAGALAPLARRLPGGIRLGTSSWSFPGWAGRVYDRETTPGVLSNHGLAAYARHPLLRCVGLDRGYYEPVPDEVIARYREQTPDDFRFVAKADRRLVLPDGPGADRELFLNPRWATDRVVGPLAAGLGRRLGAILFQFPPAPPTAFGGARRFAEDVYRFLHGLPPGIRYLVELRTAALLSGDYVQALAHAGAGHGYVVHPEMTPLPEQLESIPPAPGVTQVVRWMLQPGFGYADARDAWSPFRDLQRPDPVRRAQVAEAARAMARAGGEALVVVNNKAEGSSPASVEALARLLAESDATV
ncbi:MAG TPA: DUF72 domain-containing protein [Longimicrobiales bacterium]|nr:DUF72 domain-containing protein [Longimicrobiales bacterium]